MRIESAALGVLGAIAMFTLSPTAAADPTGPPPGPDPVLTAPADPAAEPATALAAPPEGVPHLSSPDNLPPGTSDIPADPEGHRMAYLRDLWHAVQTQEISGSGALLLLTQRPMDADTAPPPGMPAGPQGPVDAAPPPGDAPLPQQPLG